MVLDYALVVVLLDYLFWASDYFIGSVVSPLLIKDILTEFFQILFNIIWELSHEVSRVNIENVGISASHDHACLIFLSG